MSSIDLGRLVRDYRRRRDLRQADVAALLTEITGERVQQSQVSSNEHGERWTLDLPAAYQQALQIPPHEVVAALGYTTKQGPRPTTIADIIKADPSLSREAKRHLLRQYELLQMATRHERATPVGEPKREGRRRSG